MRRPVHASTAPALLVAGLLLLSAVPADAGREEAVLSWDDGTAEGSASGLVGQRMAVRFQAPPGNCGLLGMRMYSVNDGHENPVNPQDPTTMPFTVWVWRVGTEGKPGAHESFVPFTDPYAYPEDAWVDAMLPEPMDLSDPAHFPDRWFFIGIEWEYPDSPYVGLDLDPPISGESWFHDSSDWVPSDTANLMMRAVVCDSTGSPVELESWGTVKQMYR